jgi:hypothetical protein
VVILLVEIPVSAASIDERLSPVRDEYILEHLVHVCAKGELLPALSIVIEGDAARVTRNHTYLLVARMLGRSTIRAIVASPPSSVDVKRFLARPDVIVLDAEAIMAKEDEDRYPKAWHVYFFERSLSLAEKRAFDEAVWERFEVFDGRTIRVHHDDAGPLAEFETRTPTSTEALHDLRFDTIGRFDREHVRIVSYQGRRFVGL